MPKYDSLEEVSNSNLPERIDFPMDYFPSGIGPGSFDPQTMYMSALAENKAEFIHEHRTKSWVILWLLDNIDWEKVTQNGK